MIQPLALPRPSQQVWHADYVNVMGLTYTTKKYNQTETHDKFYSQRKVLDYHTSSTE